MRVYTYMSKKAAKGMPPPSAPSTLLEPGQTLAQYNKLQKKWYDMLKKQGFYDIEFISYSGHVSNYSKGYSLGRLRSRYSAEAVEYWRQITLFTLHFNWQTYKGPLNPPMARYIWETWVSKGTFKDCVAGLKKSNTPKIRFRGGKPMPAPSIFWVHTQFKQQLEPTFKAWVTGKGRKYLVVDHDLGL